MSHVDNFHLGSRPWKKMDGKSSNKVKHRKQERKRNISDATALTGELSGRQTAKGSCFEVLDDELSGTEVRHVIVNVLLYWHQIVCTMIHTQIYWK